jgi:hypothetical protein
MRISPTEILLLTALCVAGCEPKGGEASGQPLTPEQTATAERAKAELDALQNKPEAEVAAGCLRFFAAKKELLDVTSPELDGLWSKGEKTCGPSAAHKVLLERAAKDLRYLDGQMGKSSFDPQYACLSIAQARKPLADHPDPAVQKLLAKGEKMCGLDAWLSFAAVQLDRARGARDKDPGAALANECAYLQIAFDSISPAYADDARVQELELKRNEYCAAPKKG